MQLSIWPDLEGDRPTAKGLITKLLAEVEVPGALQADPMVRTPNLE